MLIPVIAQLRLLFQELITSDLAYIRPKEELVRLTLVDVKQEIEDEAIKRRQSLVTNASASILDSDIPDLIEIEDTNVPTAPVSSPVVIPTSGEAVPEIISPIRKTTSDIANIQISSAPDDTDYEFVDHESNDSGGVLACAPISVGQKGVALAEVGEMVGAGAVAVSDNGRPVVSAQLMRNALEYARTFGSP